MLAADFSRRAGRAGAPTLDLVGLSSTARALLRRIRR
jgi:hypothetical protein